MDRENVMSWLECLAEPDWRECYSDSEVQETARQALDLIDELLKEQDNCENCAIAIEDRQLVVRCKDCRNAVVYDDNEVVCAHIDSNGNDMHSIDWFCADGKSK